MGANKNFIVSYYPYILKQLLDINDEKIIRYNEKNLKKSYLIDIIHTLIKKHLYNDKTFFNLDSRILREKYGTFYNYYINYLIDNQLIKLQSNYCTGKKSKTYIIHKNVLQDIEIINNYDNILIKKYKKLYNITKLRESNYKFISYDLMIKIVNNLQKVEIKFEDADNYISNIELTKTQFLKNSHSIKTLKEGNRWYKFDKYGRFHSNLTILKSGIRNSFLLIDGEKTKEIDIVNSQPIFLTLLLSQNINKYDIDLEEYEFFKQLVIKGKLYKYISLHSNIENKKDVKKMVYTVLFGTNHLKKKENKLFKQLFPSIFNFIKSYKSQKGNYRSLAYELQRSESNLLFNIIIKEILNLYPDLPFFTVHDSITVRESDYDKVKKIFDKYIKELHEQI